MTFTLDAGASNGGKDYWLWMSVSGTYPGFPLNGLTVPLNWDSVLEFGMLHPGFPGSTGFLGQLDGSGGAQAILVLPPDPQAVMVGIPIHFAYVLTAPGPALPVLFASNHVHVKYYP